MKILKKYGLFTGIYIILTLLLSDDLSCLFQANLYCMATFLGKYAVFMLLMIAYDKWFVGGVFRKGAKK